MHYFEVDKFSEQMSLTLYTENLSKHSLSNYDRRYVQSPPPSADNWNTSLDNYPKQMQPNPNQPPEEKPHAVGFKTDEERVIFFQNVAELMWRDGVIKRNTIPAFMEHAAFETANFYLYKLMDKVKRPPLRGTNPRDPYNHLDDSNFDDINNNTSPRPGSDIF